MTEPDQSEPRVAKGVATPRLQRGHVMDVLAKLRDAGPAQYEPDVIHVSGVTGVVEVVFVNEPTGVVMWAQALGFEAPLNRVEPSLQQVLVEGAGEVMGWRVELRHVHTAVVVSGRPLHPVSILAAVPEAGAQAEQAPAEPVAAEPVAAEPDEQAAPADQEDQA